MTDTTNPPIETAPPAPSPAVRALLLELTTFRGQLVHGDYLARRAAAVLALPQEGGAE